MFISKMSLPRRTFLRGLGTALALPLLDAMVPAATALAATAAKPVRRLGCVYAPNGINMARWTPKGEGTNFEFSPTLAPMEPFRDRVTIVSQLDNYPAVAWGVDEGAGDHPRAPAAWLSAAHPKRTQGADILAGTTIDQVIAAEISKDTQITSIELSLERTDIVGACSTTGYSCVYSDTISWKTPTTPLPIDDNPRTVFERLFGDGINANDRLAQLRGDRSILDSVTQEISSFRKKLGPTDSLRVTEYLDAVRDIERRIQKAEEQSAQSAIVLPDRPAGVPEKFEDYCKLMFDLHVLAYQADLTRVITMLLAHEQNNRTYPQIGVPDPHHGTSHHEDNPEKLEKLAKIDTYHMTLFAYYLDKLRATQDGDGNLLDHVVILYGGGISDGNTHSHVSLPLLVAGGGAGSIKGGRHLIYPKKTPHANLLVALANRMGVPKDRFGDSTGEIAL